MKWRTPENKETYKAYKNLFEMIKRKSKKNVYSAKLIKFQGDTKKTWPIMKEVIGKYGIDKSSFPEKTEIVGETKITNEFNKFFMNVGIKLAQKIPQPLTRFESYTNRVNSEMESKTITVNELKEAFYYLKTNKSPGYGDISYNVVKNDFRELYDPLLHIFNLSSSSRIFWDSLKIGKVTTIYKAGDSSDLSNYRPISVLPCFSKILKRIIYNRVYTYLQKYKILCYKQFEFQAGHCTNHAIIQLLDQIYENFEEIKYMIGFFLDLSKAFGTVNHKILLSKLDIYGIKGNILKWFESYLANRKQYIQIDK